MYFQLSINSEQQSHGSYIINGLLSMYYLIWFVFDFHVYAYVPDLFRLPVQVLVPCCPLLLMKLLLTVENYAFFWIEYTIFCIEFQYFGMHGKKWICLSFFLESSYPFLIVLVKISIILERGTFLVFFAKMSGILDRGTFLVNFAKILAILERETTLLFCLKISAILERGTYVLKSVFFDTTSAKLRSFTLVLSWSKTDFIKILLFRLDFSKKGLKLGNLNFPSFFWLRFKYVLIQFHFMNKV